MAKKTKVTLEILDIVLNDTENPEDYTTWEDIRRVEILNADVIYLTFKDNDGLIRTVELGKNKK